MNVDPHAAGLYALHDPDWRQKTRRAGWLLFVPFAGWPMVLGYRRALTTHLFEDKSTAMPEWHGRHMEHFLNGVRAIGVIQGYLAPLWLALALLAHGGGFVPGPAFYWALLPIAIFPLLLNLTFPVAVFFASTSLGGEPYLAPGVGLVLGALFHIVIFLVPAGFLRVSIERRFISAFNFRRTLPFIWRHFRAYATAWWYALWMNVPALPLVVIAPWSVFWGYVASLVLFNQLHVTGERADTATASGWINRPLPNPPTSNDSPTLWSTSSIEAHGVPTKIVRTRAGSIPLP